MLKIIKNILLMTIFAAIFPIFSMEQSNEECSSGKYSSSEYSYEDINPLIHLFKPQPFNLAQFNNKSGSVLPLYTGPNKKIYAILTREARGKDKYKYDDFSGSKDKGETHPVQTCGHEFFQEALLQRTLGWNLKTTMQFLDPKNNNTIVVIAYSKNRNPKNQKSKDVKNVTYIVDFDQHSKELFNNFYKSLNDEIAHYRKLGKNWRYQPTTEKDRIAGVLLSDLKEAIINNKGQRTVQVWANVLDPHTNKFNKEQITLRPFLVSKLYAYFLNMPYEVGEHEKIRHYTIHR